MRRSFDWPISDQWKNSPSLISLDTWQTAAENFADGVASCRHQRNAFSGKVCDYVSCRRLCATNSDSRRVHYVNFDEELSCQVNVSRVN